MLVRALSASLLLAACSAAEPSASCPPPDFTSKAVFNPATYFVGRWYSLYQIPLNFQPPESFFCVTANYEIEGTQQQQQQPNTTTVRVTNASNRGGIDGPRSQTTLRGIVKDPSKPSQAVVGPPFVPPERYGPYWVVEAGTYDELVSAKTNNCADDAYEWAIVTGGPPTVSSNDACVPGSGASNSKGFWLLSRVAVVPGEATDKLRALAASKGLDVSALQPVVQNGCTYA
ncbi:hypothetical protein ATCC90586_002903 [Pythium insidiosum]|nr:hypothetical protein ATCC90586_002903 [Pythium insidiosum]